MEFDDMVDKGKKAFKDGTEKIEGARTSEKAGKIRENVVGGFDKVMRALLPGEKPKKQIEP